MTEELSAHNKIIIEDVHGEKHEYYFNSDIQPVKATPELIKQIDKLEAMLSAAMAHSAYYKGLITGYRNVKITDDSLFTELSTEYKQYLKEYEK